MEKVNANQAAKLLGISVDKLEILEKQGIIHSTVNTEGVSSYSAEEIAQIKSRRSPTLAQEAEQVAIGIQREIVSSVKAHRKVLLAAGGVLSGYALLVALFTALFFIYPLQTSDFLGYYYRFNAVKPQPSTSMINGGGSVLAAETGPVVAPGEPSVLAYILKPVAAVALVPVKAVDNQKFLQVVTPPTAGAAGLSGQAGSPGSNGANGTNGTDGTPGLTGLQGIAGASGANGTNGSNGTNGANGTSVADVLTTPGSLIIRNATNTTVPLTAGSNGQVLTISGGIPAWENSSTTTINFSGLLAGDVTGTQGATVLKNTGTAGTYGSALNIPVFVTDAQGRVTSVTNTAISGLTTSNFGSANISQWTNNSGYITTSSTDTLTNKSLSGSTNTLSNIPNSALTNSALTVSAGTGLATGGTVSLGGTVTLSLPNVGTSGTYGNATTIPVITTDAQGRVSGVTATGISGLTASNLTAGDFSSKINSGTYSINITGSAGSATNFSGSLLGDVTGTQGSTTVAKINGAVLGTTTATSGNLLIGSGTQWVTQALSNDATINSSGALTLKNTGTAGTYGSSSNIPVFVTDAQGRVTGVTNTTISGLTVSNFTSPNISQWTNNSGYLTSEADTLASVTGRGATTATPLTLSSLSNAISAGTLTATGGTINGTTIGATSPSTGVFTKINGLTITNNGTNTLTIAAGKTLTVNNSITFGGTDGTTFTLPSSSDTLVGRASTDMLTNKTISAGSNTISGLTNTNLSGTAGITNANLANSNITTAGNSGSGSVSLGGGLTFTGAGITNIVASGSTLTVTSTEADTLASVTGRGASTSTALTLNGGVTTTTSTALMLDSGTTGGVSVGTGANAKTIAIGNTTGATAVNINSGTGNVNFTVGPTSSSGKVQIGNSGTATPDLLVLDNGTADPTGVNGGMYYNTTNGKFRCFENSAWKDCTTTQGGPSAASVSDTTVTSPTPGTNPTFGTEIEVLTPTNPTIAPDTTSTRIYITGAVLFSNPAGGDDSDTTIRVRVRRGSGSCAGTQVGPDLTSTLSDPLQTNWVNFSLVDSPATTSSQAYTVCAATRDGNGAGGTNATTPTVMMTIQEIAAVGADLAEVYSTNDASIEAGDVVSLDSNLQAGMKKSQKAYDQSVLGVVSTTPGLVIGSADNEGVKAMPVALSGRVPVKVSSENGKINAGDYLTTSGTPGVAMKSTKAGAIIGTAMTSFDGQGLGQVLVFVKNGSSMGSNDVLTQLLNGANGVNDVASNSAELAKTGSASETNIVGYISQIVANIFKKTVEFFGNVIFHSDVSFLGHATFNSDTGGFAVINTGALEVTVNFDKEYQNVPVVIGSPDTAVLYSIMDVGTKGFKIKLTQVEKHDIKFSWTATAVKDAKTSVGTAPTPTPEAGTPAPTEIPTASPSPIHSMIPTNVPSITPSGTASSSAQVVP